MRNLQELDDAVLIDMLAQYTERFTQLFRNFHENDPDYRACKAVILHVTSELERRMGKRTDNNTFTSNSKLGGQTAPATQER